MRHWPAMSAGDWLLLLVAGVAGGLAGSIAGLASVATYPALLATGLGPSRLDWAAPPPTTGERHLLAGLVAACT